MLWDTHMHCNFSADSTANPEDMILSAIVKKLDGICFTDHMDYDYPGDTEFCFDSCDYFNALSALRDKYRKQIHVCIGVELGLQPHLKQKCTQFLSQQDFDFVIGSSHVVHGKDPYYPQYYQGKYEEQAYLEYFSSILENLAVMDDFDVYGHIDYVVRYGPTKNLHYSYEKYKDILDEVLIKLIAMGKGIELNMAGFKYGLSHPNPTEDVLKRYRELGGEIITIGADAHTPEHVAYDFEKVTCILKDAGFTHYTVFQKRVPTFLPL